MNSETNSIPLALKQYFAAWIASYFDPFNVVFSDEQLQNSLKYISPMKSVHYFPFRFPDGSKQGCLYDFVLHAKLQLPPSCASPYSVSNSRFPLTQDLANIQVATSACGLTQSPTAATVAARKTRRRRNIVDSPPGTPEVVQTLSMRPSTSVALHSADTGVTTTSSVATNATELLEEATTSIEIVTSPESSTRRPLGDSVSLDKELKEMVTSTKRSVPVDSNEKIVMNANHENSNDQEILEESSDRAMVTKQES